MLIFDEKRKNKTKQKQQSLKLKFHTQKQNNRIYFSARGEANIDILLLLLTRSIFFTPIRGKQPLNSVTLPNPYLTLLNTQIPITTRIYAYLSEDKTLTYFNNEDDHVIFSSCKKITDIFGTNTNTNYKMQFNSLEIHFLS